VLINPNGQTTHYPHDERRHHPFFTTVKKALNFTFTLTVTTTTTATTAAATKTATQKTSFIMSTKLVKRLLQKQLEPPPTTKKRPRDTNSNTTTLASHEIKRAHFLETTILGVDRVMSKHGEASSLKALKRVVKSKKISKVKTMMVGNSRASSSSTLAKHEPTFRKRHHAKEEKKAMLAKIAKLLDQGKKKNTSSKA
jgi:hypothetical protein